MKYTDINKSLQITGALGRPLGTILTIQGVPDPGNGSKADMDKTMFRVFKVDGKELHQPVVLPLEIFPWMSVPEPVDKETVVYIGYETGGMNGIPEQAFTHMPYVTTTEFGFSVFFQIIKRVD